MERGEQEVGQKLNFFKQVALSPASFKAFIDFKETLQSGALEIESFKAIYLATSNYNDCGYCLSIHSTVAEHVGLSQDKIKCAQQLEPESEKRTAALRLAREVVESCGHPFDDAFHEVREAGYSDEQIMEMDRHRVPCYLY